MIRLGLKTGLARWWTRPQISIFPVARKAPGLYIGFAIFDGSINSSGPPKMLQKVKEFHMVNIKVSQHFDS